MWQVDPLWRGSPGCGLVLNSVRSNVDFQTRGPKHLAPVHPTVFIHFGAIDPLSLWAPGLSLLYYSPLP